MNVGCGLEGQHFRNSIKVGFWIEPPLKSFPNDKRLPCSKKEAYTHSNQLTNLEIIIF